MNFYQEQIFLFYILSEPSICERIKSDFFNSNVIKSFFDIAKPYVLKYKEVPSIDQFKELVDLSGKSDLITDDVIQTLYKSKDSLNGYSPDWLDETTKAWAQFRNLVNALKNVSGYLKIKENEITAENAKEIVEHIKMMFNNDTNLSFDDNDGADFFNAVYHKTVKLKRHSTGYPYFDICSKGGYWAGSLWCLIGAPKSGKSLCLQNLCAESIKHGDNSAYISLELQEEIITQRIGSNLLNIDSYEYEKIADDENLINKKLNDFRKSLLIEPGYLHIKEFPTSAASVNDIENHLLKIESKLSTCDKKFKFKNIYIDYIALIRNYRNPNSENTYIKLKQISEDLRAMGQRNKWCVITASQTVREQFQSSDVTMSQISESSALIHTVDLLFGIIQDPLMKSQGVYFFKCLADRVAPYDNTKKKFLLNKSYLRIIEDINSQIEDCAITNALGSIYDKVNKKSFTQQNKLNDNSPQVVSKEDSLTLNDTHITGNGLF